MPSIFITTSSVQSKRWQQAFADAEVYTNPELSQLKLNGDTVVWLLLDGSWQEYLTVATNLGARVVALSLNESADEARRLIALGARGYVHALAAPELLQRVSKAIEYDGLWLGRDLMRQLLVAPTAQTETIDLNKLSARERAVAELVAQGLNNKEVARQLAITERTVKAHLSACFEKLNVRDRMQLAVKIRPLIRAV
ncbi:response regulator transcription factor [Gilvimarinus sp. DA14]|uniref:response regulator transcription factor n=1 Tax=Gilvimarinus sp. DA14 TaxID=2956798 RepID=UPI00273A7249|nr:response regulator transcription factor [Gilvimarinus sp. DA14]